MATEVKQKSWWQKALFDSDAGKPVEDVSNTQPTNQPIQQARPIVKSTTPIRKVTPVVVSAPIITDDGDEIDESYINHLYDFMAKNNFPDKDYFEFANSLDEMTTELDGASEEKIYQMTYKVAYKDLPVPILIETAQKYLQLFGQHKKEFDDYLVSESQKTIGTKGDESVKLQKTNGDALIKIEELKKQITNLENQIETNNSKIEENNNFIEIETEKLALKKSKFEKAYNVIINKINSDINKIKTYLTAYLTK